MLNNIFHQSTEIEAFWAWFLEREQFYYHLELYDMDDLFEQLGNALHKVNENLTFEFSQILPNDKREFTISADGIRSAFPAVIQLIDAAPTLTKWKLVAFRQPASTPICIQIENISISYDDIKFKYHIHNRELALTFYVKDFTAPSPVHEVAICILLDALLGEYDAVTKIRYVDLAPLRDAEPSEDLFPFPTLKDIVKQRALN